MRRFLISFVVAGSCCIGCQVPEAGSTGDSEVATLQLRANGDGDLESCDAAGSCAAVENPDGCTTLVVTIDTSTGAACERCVDAGGDVIYERCDDTHVICTVVVAPDPDCVVCAYDQGPIVFSSCVVPEPEPCRPGECGPAPDCPLIECWDGSRGGCTDRCLRDPVSDLCGWEIRECPPPPIDCDPTDCGRSVCPSIPCPDGTWTTDCACVASDDGTCHWEPIDTCEPGRQCYSDEECPDGTHCEGTSPCPDGTTCLWTGAGRCVPNDEACTEAECGPAPDCPVFECPDGSLGGCIDRCERDADGTCGWVIRQCPPEPGQCDPTACGRSPCPSIQCPDGTWTTDCACVANDDGTCRWEPINTCEPGRCRWDSDCPPGYRCEGSSVCPPDAVCLWSGEPGWCEPTSDRCTADECGPAPECPVFECPDGSLGGCIDRCERDANGTCGWVIRECPPEPCSADECGPAPECPAILCWDGSIGGCTGICERHDDGTCGWLFRECPPDPCSVDDCGAPPPCGAPLSCADGSIAGCSCQRDAATGVCGWTSQECP